MVRLLKELYCKFRGGHQPTLMEVWGSKYGDALRCNRCNTLVQEVAYARTRRRR